MPDDPMTTHACPRCAHENDADTHFCANCGLNIDGLCPDCGTQNEHSTHFCSNCGHDFAAGTESSAPASHPATGDLRVVHEQTSEHTAPPSFEAQGVECPRCHRVNEPGAVFCYNCGLPFDNAAGVSPPDLTPRVRFSLGKAFSFEGRITNWTYLAFMGLAFVIGFICGAIYASATVDGNTVSAGVGFILIVIIVIGAWIELAALVRRFRDAAVSFWLLLLMLIPFGGFILFILALVLPSKPAGAKRY